jgi:hypothetical protein
MYHLKSIGLGEQAPPANTLAYQNWNKRAPGWQRVPAAQTLELRKSLAHWYALRPYGTLGGLNAPAAAQVDGVAVVTGELRVWLPVNLWRYFAGLGILKRPYSVGTFAAVPLPPGLPAMDVLPQGAQWPAVTVNRLAPFTRAKTYATARALPSGASVTPVESTGRPELRLDMLRPLALDPAAALSVLSLELTRLTLDEGIAWAVEGDQLYVWTRRWLRGVYRPRLAACATHVRKLLVEAADRAAGTA